jgi:hypothetical protein
VDGVLQATCGTGELGENEGSMFISLANNVFQTGSVHAITNTGNQANIGGSEQGEIFFLGKILWVMLNRRESQRTINSVDLHDKIGYLVGDLVSSILLLLFHARRTGDLDQHNLLSPLRVLLKESLESHEFLCNTTNAIQAIPTNDNLLALVHCPQSEYFLVDNMVVKSKLFNCTRVNSNGKYSNCNFRSICIYPNAV